MPIAKVLRKSLGVIAAIIVLAVVPAAFAASPPAYRGAGGKVEAVVHTTHSGSVGQLPFTGMNLATFGVVGVALVGAGFSLRRFARKR